MESASCSSDSEIECNLYASDEEGTTGVVCKTQGQVQGYRYEPPARKPTSGSTSIGMQMGQQEHASGTTPSRVGQISWCQCGNCVPMPTDVESLCCYESIKIKEKMEAFVDEKLLCMTDHPGFVVNCLNPWVLEVAYYQYKQQYQAQMEFAQNEIYRHTAYRQLVRMCWKIVGRNNRIPLPSCCVNKIRKTFPDPNEQYTGFKWPAL